MNDLRNAESKATDTFLASDAGQRVLEGATSGQYLCNRITIAFLAGFEAGRHAPVEAPVKRPKRRGAKP